MSQVIPAFTPRIESLEFARKQPWGLSVKNALLGSLENWRDHVLTIGSIYYVAQAAFFLIGGYWMVSFISICTSALLARMRKELREFADLRKETGDYQTQNSVHRMTNLQQKQITVRLEKNIEELETNVQKFTDEIKSLQKESKKFQKSNNNYAYHNKVHETLITSLSSTSKKLASEIREALNQGTQLSHKTLQGFVDTLGKIEEQKAALGSITTQLKAENIAAIERFEKLAKEIQGMRYDGIRSFRQADQKLARKLQEIDDATAELARIKDEIAEATQINKKAAKFSEEAAKFSRDAAEESYAATKKANLASSVYAFMHNNFFASSEVNPATGEPNTDWAKVIFLAGGLTTLAMWLRGDPVHSKFLDL